MMIVNTRTLNAREMARPKTAKGRAVKMLAQFIVAGPWRSAGERFARSIGHKFPMNPAVRSFCRHLGGVLIEREGQRFERVAVFESGGRMRCSGEDYVALLSSMYYFVGTISGQHHDERPIVKLLRRAISSGDIFFDIGANVGFYSFFAAPLCGKSGTVHAFEANPVLIPHLRRSVEVNSGSTKIVLNPVAVGSQPGSLELYDPDRIGGSSVYKLAWLNTERSVTVPVTTIDAYRAAQQIKRIDVVKIDIEGAELDAFYGMKETFEICPPWLIVCELAALEVSGSAAARPASSEPSYPVRIIEFLSTKGYEARYISEKDGRLGSLVDVHAIGEMAGDLINIAFVPASLKQSKPDLFSQKN